MDKAEFDRHAKDYRRQQIENIAISGEDPEYFADYKIRDFKALLIKMGLPLDGRYLDFGSGIGGAIKWFRHHLPDAQLVCADVSSESLSLSREVHGEAVEYVHLQGEVFPFLDGCFDGAFACCVFHHIPPSAQIPALKEIKRVLKPGSALMVYEHNPYNPLTVRSVRNCPFDENAILLTSSQMRRMYLDAGFHVTGVDYRVFFPAFLSALRPIENHMRWMPLGAQYFVAGRA
jgi:ubiquinone/menaquinone biosynthesis C-methylase UbiE